MRSGALRELVVTVRSDHHAEHPGLRAGSLASSLVNPLPRGPATSSDSYFVGQDRQFSDLHDRMLG